MIVLKRQDWFWLYVLPHPLVLLLVWYALFSCGWLDGLEAAIGRQTFLALQTAVMLLSLVWPVYLAYKVVGALPWRWFLLFNVSSLLISQLLVDFWDGFCAEGYSPTSLGGYNEFATDSQFIFMLWLVLLALQVVVWISVRDIKK